MSEAEAAEHRIMRPEELIAQQQAKMGVSETSKVDQGLKKLAAKQKANSGQIMSNQHDIPGVWEARVLGQARGTYQLPCGFVDLEGTVFQWILMREMDGVEEDFIASDEVSVNERSSQALSNCILKLMTDEGGDQAITDPELIRQIVSGQGPSDGSKFNLGKPLTSNDRTAGILFLRRTTLGDQYKPEVRCPIIGCGILNRNQRIDLETIEIKRVPRDQAHRRSCKIILPRCSSNSGGKQVVKAKLHVLDGADEGHVALMKPTKKNYRSLQILARLKGLEIYDVGEDGELTLVEEVAIPKLPEHALKMVQSLPKQDRDQIRMTYLKIEGSVDTDITVTCEHCNREFTFPLDLGQIFFWTRADQKEIKDSDIEWD